MERKTRFELATLALGRRCSAVEPLSHEIFFIMLVYVNQVKLVYVFFLKKSIDKIKHFLFFYLCLQCISYFIFVKRQLNATTKQR